MQVTILSFVAGLGLQAVTKVLPTAQKKTVDLRELYTTIRNRHQNFVEKTLPMIPPSHADRAEFSEADYRTQLLDV